MINEKEYHSSCECSHLEIKIREIRTQFESGLIDKNEYDQRVKSLILMDMFDQYRNEFMGSISKLCTDLEKSIDYHTEEDDSGSGIHTLIEESQLQFRQRCFKEFESLMKGVNNPKPTDD
jgi:hypothetical protein|tara:strand:- start:999 stop:1358 length:360 start_codon:yes stop_codon:yes gene_type:complete